MACVRARLGRAGSWGESGIAHEQTADNVAALTRRTQTPCAPSASSTFGRDTTLYPVVRLQEA